MARSDIAHINMAVISGISARTTACVRSSLMPSTTTMVDWRPRASAAAKRTTDLLRDPERATEMGDAGREHVRKNFLSTRELEDWLRLFTELR